MARSKRSRCSSVTIPSIATLYPDTETPAFGVFVEKCLRKLAERLGVRLGVMAPVPWFPIRRAMIGRYGRFARVPAMARRHGIEVSCLRLAPTSRPFF